MLKWSLSPVALMVGVLLLATRLSAFEEDLFKTAQGDLKMTFIGHGSLMISWNGKILQIDPVSRYGDYGPLGRADIILVTHEHGDHLDPALIGKLTKPATEVFITQKCAEKLPSAVVMKNGDSRTCQGIKIEAVPAYNIVAVRSPGNPFHPKGDGNGYVLTFADKRVYIAGDTENIPEMKRLGSIDIAFLPMNLPYTMSPEMAAEAARIVMPKILYPYHYGDTDVSRLVALLKDQKGIDVRVRNMK